ncbi:protein FAM217A isoform X4 [Rhinatrema bivittatum]|uniref:protein FAM217A isoform X4 n=1 Tax=Rhinatrema bivittatum TaxID=194408 RepID=UPI001125E0D4|nr:protein FAM217A isoform X4 [Rhinatrema bivittatum]
MTSPGPLHMSIHPPRSVSLGLLGGGGEGTSLRGRRRDSHYCEESGLTRGLLEPLLSPWQQDNYRIAVKQMEDLNLMENMVRKMQLHQHGPFSSKQLTSDTCSPNLRNATENRSPPTPKENSLRVNFSDTL